MKNIPLILKLLAEYYPQAGTALRYADTFQLLVAVVLSARSNDEQVNRITPELFAAYATPWEMAAADPVDVTRLIRGCGLYRNKSKNLVAAARRIVEHHGGEVPSTMNELLGLPGVGRKTANVMLSCAFGKPAIAVDTHVFRVSRRLGLAKGNTPNQVEQELMKVIPCFHWSALHHRLIAHGRKVCLSLRPKCGNCFLRESCHFFVHK